MRGANADVGDSGYVIGTGWWCGSADGSGDRPLAKGDEIIRGVEFHRLWYAAIDGFTRPGKIFMVDSASPVRPPLNPEDPRIEYVRLDHNAGHSSVHTGRYAGWTRSVLLGIQYANLCQADYFVYVEQDALVFGEGIVEAAITAMRRPFMFGHPGNTPQPLQQSFFVIRRDGFEPFLRRYAAVRSADSRVAPEKKFALASSPLLGMLPEFLFYTRSPTASPLSRLLGRYDLLPFGYGRNRPLQFAEPHFYFQHGSGDEIRRFCDLSGFAPPGIRASAA